MCLLKTNRASSTIDLLVLLEKRSLKATSQQLGKAVKQNNLHRAVGQSQIVDNTVFHSQDLYDHDTWSQ